MKESYEKISPTAKFVAYLRSFTNIPFAREIALETGAEKTFQELTGESKESTVRLAPFWEARYRVTDRILAEYSVTQVLEIAAGLSPRGLAMTEKPDVVYVVTDLPQVLDEEKEVAETILANSNIRRPNLHFQPANAFDMESLSTAAAAFECDRPIAIITEGLLPYLNRIEKEALAGNIQVLLRKHHGLWITSDVHSKQYLQETSKLDDNMQKRLTSISRATERTLESNVFADENDIKQFFDKAGFRMVEYPHSSVLEDLSSVKLLNLTQDEMQKIHEVLRTLKTLILTPRDI
jgi:O-methyltransferase involved in polyketide biosynthesis